VGVVGLEQRLPVGQGEQRRRRKRPGEVRRVPREGAAQDFLAVQGRQLEPVGLEEAPGTLDQLGCDDVLAVVEEVDISGGVRRAAQEGAQPDPPASDGDDVEAPVVVAFDLGQLEQAPDAEEGLGSVGLAVRLGDLEALADRDRAEQALRGVGLGEELLDQCAVALLEDMERHAHAREDHGVQREQRQRPGHVPHPRLGT
jgi:hypothetical protein